MAGWYGFEAVSTGRTVKFTTYKVFKTDKARSGSVSCYRATDTYPYSTDNKQIAENITDDGDTFSFTPDQDGLYVVEWKTGKIIRAFVKCEGGLSLLCRAQPYSIYADDDIRTEDWDRFMSQFSLERMTDTYVWYPTHREYPEDIVDTENFEKLAADLIDNNSDLRKSMDSKLCKGKDELTDPEKVFIYTNWIAQKYAYDFYRVNVLTRHSTRAKDETNKTGRNGYANPDNFTYTNHVGVCWDFSVILCVMCRSQGIPAAVITTEDHAISAVYLNGEWVSIDHTAINLYGCDDKDYQEDNWYYLGDSNYSWPEYCAITPRLGKDDITCSYDGWGNDGELAAKNI